MEHPAVRVVGRTICVLWVAALATTGSGKSARAQLGDTPAAPVADGQEVPGDLLTIEAEQLMTVDEASRSVGRRMEKLEADYGVFANQLASDAAVDASDPALNSPPPEVQNPPAVARVPLAPDAPRGEINLERMAEGLE